MRDYHLEFEVLEEEFNKKIKIKYGKCWEYDSEKDIETEMNLESADLTEKYFLDMAVVENYNFYWGDFWEKMHLNSGATEEQQDYFDDYLVVHINIFDIKNLGLSKKEIENILSNMLLNAKNYISDLSRQETF